MTPSLFHGSTEHKTKKYSEIKEVDFDRLTHPKYYKASKDLAAAVNVAITLGMPLLITGEPGSGKSQLARRIAWELFPEGEDKILKFSVKSTTEAKDLFYTFDTVGRFHAAYTGRVLVQQQPVAINNSTDQGGAPLESNNIDAVNFINYQALGLALLRAKGKQGVDQIDETIMQQRQYLELPDTSVRSVVLIDEIDKAPREVPNDILTEIENMEFTIPELDGIEIKLDKNRPDPRPIIVITSNSERDLPEAFLRRCVFFHVSFPPFDINSDQTNSQVSVRSIVQARFNQRFQEKSPLLDDVLAFAKHLRAKESKLSKLPSLAELLNWVDLLLKMNLDVDQGLLQANHNKAQFIETVIPTLLKTIDDQAYARRIVGSWWETQLVGNRRK